MLFIDSNLGIHHNYPTVFADISKSIGDISKWIGDIFKSFGDSIDEFEKSELSKFGLLQWQHMHETCLFWRDSFSAVVITMHSLWYQELHLLHRVARWLDNTDLSLTQEVLLGPGFGLMSPACIRSKVVTITGPFLSVDRICWYVKRIGKWPKRGEKSSHRYKRQ